MKQTRRFAVIKSELGNALFAPTLATQENENCEKRIGGILGDRLILCRTFIATCTSPVQPRAISNNDLISKLMDVSDTVY